MTMIKTRIRPANTFKIKKYWVEVEKKFLFFKYWSKYFQVPVDHSTALETVANLRAGKWEL